MSTANSLAAMFETAKALDVQDPLAEFRHRFVIADDAAVYLDGNSLGRLPKEVPERLQAVIADEWGVGLVGSWKRWFDLPQRLGAKISRLLGVAPEEVVVCDSTSINLFKLTVAALQRQRGRTEIVTDSGNFPSDVYVTSGAAGLVGADAPHLVDVETDLEQASRHIENRIGGNTALVTLSHTLFKSGYVHDMALLSQAARSCGALSLWDLSHSIGAVPIDLTGAGADLAVGCSYKYLNGGPGAPAFLYVRKELQEMLRSPVWGWFGQREPFEFSLEYSPAKGVSRFLAGTPPVLSMAAMEPGIDLLIEAGMDRIREKSLCQTDFLIAWADRRLGDLGFRLITPREGARRGSHVSLAHPEAWRINQALIEEKDVVPDFRAPDVLRLGVTPLYTTFHELALCIQAIEEIVTSGSFRRFSHTRAAVT